MKHDVSLIGRLSSRYSDAKCKLSRALHEIPHGCSYSYSCAIGEQAAAHLLQSCCRRGIGAEATMRRSHALTVDTVKMFEALPRRVTDPEE
jgi:hypothetical protein